MPIVTEEIMIALCAVLCPLPIGTRDYEQPDIDDETCAKPLP
jgi:hypothetical protein